MAEKIVNEKVAPGVPYSAELIAGPGHYDALYAMLTGEGVPEGKEVTPVELHQKFMDAVKKASVEAFVDSFESMTAEDEELVEDSD